ncbi:MAG: MerR family transcriptional regulator [Pseudomonadota bacterium]
MSFTKKQVSGITGLSPRLVQYYTERRVVYPEVDEGAGRGNVRRYSKGNVLQFSVIKALADYNVSFKTIEVSMKALPIAFLTWQDGPAYSDFEGGWEGMLKEGLFGRHCFIVLTQSPNLPPFIVSTEKPGELGLMLFATKLTGDVSSLLVINLKKILENIRSQ